MLRSSFVVAEVALALIIASAAGALLQSLVGLQRVELGYRPDSVFVARLSLPPRQYQSPAELARFTDAMSVALGGGSEVVFAGGTTLAPRSGALASIPFASAANRPTRRRDWRSATYQSVSAGYLAAIGGRLIAGRFISEQDDGAAPPVAVVNRTMAEKYFEGTGAVGRELLIDDNNTGPRTVTIVGVVEDPRDIDLDGPLKPGVFIFGVSAGSPMLLAAVSAILLSTALLASWLPGVRASRIDTLEALSAE